MLVLVMLAALCIGTQRISMYKAIFGLDGPDRQILLQVRMPRVMIGGIVGAGLAGAGVVCQVLLNNPLADPYLLGVSSGAGLGAVLATLCGLGWTVIGISWIGIAAFAGALLALALVWWLGKLVTGLGQPGLILAGVVVNATISASIMILVALARSDQVYSTLFWLIGNVSEEGIAVVWLAGLVVLVCLTALFVCSSRLNLFCFGQQQARLMGVHTERIQLIAFGLAGLMTATAVALAGLVGFVGLVVPHAVRLILGPDCRQLLPMSAIIGAAFMVVCDAFCRVIVAPAQLPVGVATALVGGPVFMVLLLRGARQVRPV